MSQVVFRKISTQNVLKQRFSLNRDSNDKESTTTTATKQTIAKKKTKKGTNRIIKWKNNNDHH